ncbi:hypothetical protein KC678_05675 [Candidatus Dojkabacteria bacterium]|uniref:Uncharacterized protein n=1 Tax=Candidatus Dojkabacteria bacterium TaxID=2099670 RepID=A0A955RH14_9BACT|nr:hypothetical protein [Candidatus Dojkabacteria bacterium]
MNLKDIRKGDIFSESSVYVFQENVGNQYKFKHLSSGQIVTLDNKYVENLLVTADQYDKTVTVGKEDKHWTEAQIKKESSKANVGDLKQEGIRTIFENIGNEVFTVCFQKADKPLTKKRRQELIDAQAQAVVDAVEAAKTSKKSMIEAAKTAAMEIANNPVLLNEPGEERILRGYKQQFSSRDGRYNCMDIDIMETRPVNINTLLWVVVNNVKYILE